MKTLISLTIATSLFATTTTSIGIGSGRNYVSNSPIENFNFLHLRATKEVKKNQSIRIEYERSEKILNNKTNLEKALLNYEYQFNKKNIITPYIFIGAGYQVVNGNYPNNYIADTGIGAKTKLKNNIDLFSEIRILRDFGNNDNHFSGLIGISYNFENKRLPEVQVNIPNPKPIDSDKDNIPNNIDKCPNTPIGVKVDENGCPIDSDNDGVPNYLDKCPNTPKKMKVNLQGCPITFKFDIQFDANSAKIKPKFTIEINKFVKFLQKNPTYHADIQGYTDSSGNPIQNQLLSEKRAKAIYLELIKLGIDKHRITWVGFGDKNPIASNNTKEGREKNRRVIAKLYSL